MQIQKILNLILSSNLIIIRISAAIYEEQSLWESDEIACKIG